MSEPIADPDDEPVDDEAERSASELNLEEVDVELASRFMFCFPLYCLAACLMLDAVVFILIVKHDGLALLGILLSVAAGVIALQTAGSVYLFAPRLSARLVWIYSRLLGETLSTTHERIEAPDPSPARARGDPGRRLGGETRLSRARACRDGGGSPWDQGVPFLPARRNGPWQADRFRPARGACTRHRTGRGVKLGEAGGHSLEFA